MHDACAGFSDVVYTRFAYIYDYALSLGTLGAITYAT
jgi:hypothetical protein